MLDCGLNVSLSIGKLLRVADVFVSHGHIDHMSGLDWLVRVNLTRDKVLNLYGPEPLTEQVQGRLRTYTWNLDTSGWVTVACHEIGQDTISTTILPCDNWFVPTQPPQVRRLQDGVIPHPRLQVHFAALDHGVASIAYSLQTPPRMNVDTAALAAAQLSPGPWLRELKSRARQALTASEDEPGQIELPADDRIQVNGRSLPTKQLIADLLTVRPGFKLAYVTDTVFSEQTRGRIVALAQRADVLLCEAVFLNRDADRARRSYHLTARQAGQLAAEAGADELVLFHFSGRYADDYAALVREARQQFPHVRAFGIA